MVKLVSSCVLIPGAKWGGFIDRHIRSRLTLGEVYLSPESIPLMLRKRVFHPVSYEAGPDRQRNRRHQLENCCKHRNDFGQDLLLGHGNSLAVIGWRKAPQC